MITNSESILQIRLDTVENQLLIVHTLSYIVLCCIAIASYMTGLMAMNIENPVSIHLRNSFTTVTAVTFTFTIVSTGTLWKVFKYVKILPRTIFM